MSHILLVEDDDGIASCIQKMLKKDGNTVIRCGTLQEGQERIKSGFDAVLLDLALPDGSVAEFYRYVKVRNENIPVIFLTDREESKSNPILLSQLSSRIRAALRRATGEKGAILTCGGIALDTLEAKGFLNGQCVTLTAGEYRLLKILMENQGQTMERTRLLEFLWEDGGKTVSDNTLTVTMKRLREKLWNPREIQTVRGKGYRMEGKK